MTDIKEFTAQLSDKEWYIRRNAAIALLDAAEKGIDISQAIPSLTNALSDKAKIVRQYAAAALSTAVENGANISPAIPALGKALSNNDPIVRQNAVVALRHAAKRGLDISSVAKKLEKTSVEFEKKEEPEVRKVEGNTLPVFIKKLKSKDPEERAAAAFDLEKAAEQIDITAAMPALIKALDDESEKVRVCAELVLKAVNKKRPFTEMFFRFNKMEFFDKINLILGSMILITGILGFLLVTFSSIKDIPLLSEIANRFRIEYRAANFSDDLRVIIWSIFVIGLIVGLFGIGLTKRKVSVNLRPQEKVQIIYVNKEQLSGYEETSLRARFSNVLLKGAKYLTDFFVYVVLWELTGFIIYFMIKYFSFGFSYEAVTFEELGVGPSDLFFVFLFVFLVYTGIRKLESIKQRQIYYLF